VANLALYRTARSDIINGLSRLGNNCRPRLALTLPEHGGKTSLMNRPFRLRRLVPLAVTLGLLAWVMTRVTPRELVQAASQLNWPPLLAATAVMVVGLYLWDAVCLPTVYRVEDHRISYRQALHLRGLSYLGGALNYELGQGALAWGMARTQDTGLLRMLTRSVLLAYHDIVVLLSAGLVGSLLTDDPRVVRLRTYIALGLGVALACGALVWLLPTSIRARLRWAGSTSLLEDWSIARSARLVPLRLVYFGILVVYASVALAICRMPVDHEVVLSTVPLVLLADGLPNFAGLGTRETSLQLLLTPDARDAGLLAMSLFWSVGMIVGRLAIALAHLWGRQWQNGNGLNQQSLPTPTPDD